MGSTLLVTGNIFLTGMGTDQQANALLNIHTVIFLLPLYLRIALIIKLSYFKPSELLPMGISEK